MMKIFRGKARSSSQGAARTFHQDDTSLGLRRQKENLKKDINMYKEENDEIKSTMKDLQEMVMEIKKENERLRTKMEENKFQQSCLKTDLTELKQTNQLENEGRESTTLENESESNSEWNVTSSSIRNNRRLVDVNPVRAVIKKPIGPDPKLMQRQLDGEKEDSIILLNNQEKLLSKLGDPSRTLSWDDFQDDDQEINADFINLNKNRRQNAHHELVFQSSQSPKRETMNKDLFESLASAYNQLNKNKNVSKSTLYHFNGKTNEDIDAWFFTLERYFKKADISQDEKVDFAVDYLRDGALTTYRSIENRDSIPWNEFKRIFYSAYQCQNIQKVLRKKLASLRQTGTITEYIHSFNHLINQIKNMSEDDKIDRFTEGLREETSVKVAFEEPATLAEAKALAQRFEAYFGPRMGIEYGSKTNFPRSKPYQNKQFPSNRNQQEKNEPKQDTKHKQETKKDLSSIKCYTCKQFGHYSRDCKNVSNKNDKSANCAQKVESDMNKNQQNNNEKELKACMSQELTIQHNNLLTVKGEIEGHVVECVLDTGATSSVISKNMVEKLGLKTTSDEVCIRLADGQLTKCQHTVPLSVVICARHCKIPFMVMPNNHIDVLIGLDWFIFHGVSIDPGLNLLSFRKEQIDLNKNEKIVLNEEESFVAEVCDEPDIEDNEDWFRNPKEFSIENLKLKEEQIEKALKFLQENLNQFATKLEELGRCTVRKHKIRTTTEKPIFIYPYRKSEAERKLLKIEVEKLLKAGIIKPSKSAWSFPVVLIPKRDGTKRFCVDFRKLNEITEQDCFPMPRIDDILDGLKGSTIFTVIDLKSGYWQMELDEESMDKASFSTPDGHFSFKVVAMGLKCAPADFGRTIYLVLGDLPFVKVYLDDITIHSNSFEEHMEHVKIVFERLSKAGLKLNKEKCTWFSSSIKLLGHIVSSKGIEMDTEKVRAINEMPYCRNVKQVQQFLGLCGYYRKFVKDFAKIAAPLYELIKKKSVFNFDLACQVAFDKLKENLMKQPILRQPVPDRKFTLYTDASGFALGAILSQKDENGKEYVCGYISRLLKGAEVHYGITEKECLAVVWAIKYYRIYLYGTKFEVITDHVALKWLMNINDPTGRLARWAIYLQIYDFEIIHRKGKSHQNVDALSRPVLAVEQAK